MKTIILYTAGHIVSYDVLQSIFWHVPKADGLTLHQLHSPGAAQVVTGTSERKQNKTSRLRGRSHSVSGNPTGVLESTRNVGNGSEHIFQRDWTFPTRAVSSQLCLTFYWFEWNISQSDSILSISGLEGPAALGTKGRPRRRLPSWKLRALDCCQCPPRSSIEDTGGRLQYSRLQSIVSTSSNHQNLQR